jgi:hypothetical protein
MRLFGVTGWRFVSSGILLPLAITKSLPRWNVALPLGMLLALGMGMVAWSNPALFFKNRQF